MTAKARAPLTPAFATYLGLAQIEGANPPLVERRHILRWASQSREGKEHFSSCDERGGDLRCTCEGWAHRRSCKHELGHLPTLAHFGVTFGPPPADPGGAALDRAQRDVDAETRAWAESPELAGLTASGDAAHEPRTLDDLVAAGGDAWLVSRSATRVTLTCAACYGVRIKFESAVSAPSLLAGSEEAAASWLANGGACGCGGGRPPPPAQGAARKPLRDHLDLLYGRE
jgi:hypothetical protein